MSINEVIYGILSVIMKIERNLLALMEAASHAFSRGYSGQQDSS